MQVSLSTAFAPMVSYDEGRSFKYLIHPQKCRKAKLLLDRSVREYGDVGGGAKAYFDATLKDGKLLSYTWTKDWEISNGRCFAVPPTSQ
jgi:hypothetical protein